MEKNLNINHLSESDIESKTTSTNYFSFLKGSKRKIVELMQDAQFRTLKQIEDATNIIPTTSSALLTLLTWPAPLVVSTTSSALLALAFFLAVSKSRLAFAARSA